MSVIYFASRTDSAEVAGTERFHMLGQLNRLAGRGGEGWAIPGPDELNACLQLGNDVAALLARLSGQLEMITWVDGPNRAWLAGLIAQALQRDTTAAVPALRAEAGWPAAVQLLLADDAEPVFISTTGGRPWPNADGWEGSPEEWHALSHELQWCHAEGLLRQESAAEDATSYLAEHPVLVAAPFSRELRPANWSTFFFASDEVAA
jgi:hypothetical protein